MWGCREVMQRHMWGINCPSNVFTAQLLCAANSAVNDSVHPLSHNNRVAALFSVAVESKSCCTIQVSQLGGVPSQLSIPNEAQMRVDVVLGLAAGINPILISLGKPQSIALVFWVETLRI
ncbi:hypothetical protein TNIN_497741 [Trichonephila inaurata madagascariensis]|uniref:Uncharacterized protein n=1 Tax=Trichonephila inaurata madagascariensis TaxID=2747483 RepID=A0A8X6WUY5_9ARAC|nr:hypothetical protein TNIN_497741 [Trichonephila inaurata madagascariensis]